ncbi:MAG: hypothetical protein LBC92_05875 [Rickettsiales bacterium]|jgi:hypothetical protein|nr:hypothetical protein [Rickettsiales bacterium]
MTKYIFFSPIGDHDPINTNDFSDGSMLNIVRNYKPKIIYLLFTLEMVIKDETDNRYEKAIRKIHENCEIIKIYTQIDNPQIFNIYDDFEQEIKGQNKYGKYLTNGKTGIVKELLTIHSNNGQYEILINITSGTPQIKSYLTALSMNFNFLKPIQVVTIANSSNCGTKAEFNINMLENIKMEINDNRCQEPEISNLRKIYLIEQIKVLLNEYEYSAILKLLELENNKSLFKDDLYKKVKEGRERLNFKYKKINSDGLSEYYQIMKINQKKGNLSHFILQLEVIMDAIAYKFCKKKNANFDDCLEENDRGMYCLQPNKLLEIDKKLFNFINTKFDGNFGKSSLNRISHVILEYYGKSSIKWKDIRNSVAHGMRVVDESDFRDFGGSLKILEKIEELLMELGIDTTFYYDELNKEIEGYFF